MGAGRACSVPSRPLTTPQWQTTLRPSISELSRATRAPSATNIAPPRTRSSVTSQGSIVRSESPTTCVSNDKFNTRSHYFRPYFSWDRIRDHQRQQWTVYVCRMWLHVQISVQHLTTHWGQTREHPRIPVSSVWQVLFNQKCTYYTQFQIS